MAFSLKKVICCALLDEVLQDLNVLAYAGAEEIGKVFFLSFKLKMVKFEIRIWFKLRNTISILTPSFY